MADIFTLLKPKSTSSLGCVNILDFLPEGKRNEVAEAGYGERELGVYVFDEEGRMISENSKTFFAVPISKIITTVGHTVHVVVKSDDVRDILAFLKGEAESVARNVTGNTSGHGDGFEHDGIWITEPYADEQYSVWQLSDHVIDVPPYADLLSKLSQGEDQDVTYDSIKWPIDGLTDTNLSSKLVPFKDPYETYGEAYVKWRNDLPEVLGKLTTTMTLTTP